MAQRKWIQERVLEAIGNWHKQGVPLTQIWKVDATLYRYAKRYFGTWKKAVVAAGFTPVRKTWTKQSLIAAIQARHRQGLPMQDVQRHDVALYVAACRHFHRWVDALRAAGLKPHTRRKWTKERVIQAIQDRHRQGVPIGKIWTDRTLCMAATSRFGTWRKALAAAGLQSVRQQWSKERVLSELRQRYPRNGARIGRKPNDHRLAGAAARYFGSWHDALVAAGLRSGKRRVCRSWTKEEVIEAIRDRHQQGLSLSQVSREDKALYSVAKRIFGSWREALEAAGFPLPPTKEWTREEVLREIHALRDQGIPLVGIWKDHAPLYAAVKKFFGNGRHALLAAGLELKPLQTWTKQSVIEAILRRRQEGRPLSRVWKEDKPLFRAATRKFGSWEKALRAAGLQPKPRRKWSRERVIADLQAWRRHSNESLQKADPTLRGVAIRLFGNLEQAMEAAGVEALPGRWTSRRVVEAIQNCYVQGRPINIAGFGDTRLACAAKRRFGSWAEAVAAAGLSDKYTKPPPTRTWTKEAVLDAIRAWHAQGRPMSNVSKQDQGLYSAAKKFFGTWRAAVIAAGLEPTRKRWSEQRVIREIRARHDRGLPLTSIVFKQDAPLAGAGTRMFGGWREAVAAAGLAPPSETLPTPRKTA